MNEATEIANVRQRQFLEEVLLSNALRDSLVIRKGRRVFVQHVRPQDRKEFMVLKENFRNALQSKLRSLARRYYSCEVDGISHIEHIKELVEVSRRYAACLNDQHLVFGRAQKALNVYLKYLWCAFSSVSPPHCPFDNIVIGRLKLPAGCEHRWTHADAEESYREWVKAATSAKKPSQSLAEWELEVWSRAQAKLKAQARKSTKLHLPSGKPAESYG